MAITVTQLYNTNFFSQVGTEYVCTGFMYGMAAADSINDQLSNKGVFMDAQVLINPDTGETYPWYDFKVGLSGKTLQKEAAQAAQAKSTGGASNPGMSFKPGGGTGVGY